MISQYLKILERFVSNSHWIVYTFFVFKILTSNFTTGISGMVMIMIKDSINTAFNNISLTSTLYIKWEIRVPKENHRPGTSQ